MPQQVTVETDGATDIIRYRWFVPTERTVVIVPGLLLGIPAILIMRLSVPVGNEWIALGICFLVWSACTYCYVATVLNATEFRISKSYISVVHSPIPWRAPPRIDSSKVEGVFAREVSAWQNDGGATVTAEIVAATDGAEIILLKHMSRIEIAYDIASLVREHMTFCPSRKVHPGVEEKKL